MAQHRISLGVGADIATQQIIDCKARFADIPNVRFCTVSELVHEKHLGAYDVVNCMETLEHCPHPVVDNVIRDLVRFVKPEGQVVISVPIETGLTFLGKTIIRKLAAMRNLSDYRYYESYSFTNALRMIFANRRTALTRPVYGGPENPSHSHYGFNWRTMRDRVKQHLTLEEIRFSPLGWLGGALSSQAWFICRPYTSTQRPDPNGIRERFIRIPA